MTSHNPNAPTSPTASTPSASQPVPGCSSINIRVRYSECDPMGVAHHASYLPWMELGRTELLRDMGMTYKALESQGVFLVITKLDIRYRRPIRYDDIVEVRATIEGGSRVKLRHTYQFILVERDSQPPDHALDPSIPIDGVLSTATTELACVDKGGKVQPLPDWLHQE